MTLTKKDFAVNQDIPWMPLVVFFIIHLLMLIYDIAHPEVFLHADRASYRWDVIRHFGFALNEGSVIEFLSSNGLAGDYLFHGLIFFSIGKNGLIIFQILLTLLSGYAVYGIARLWGFARGISATTCGIYLALPHTLIFPHQLASESIYSPLVVISLWLIAYFWGQKKGLALAGSAVFIGLATFIRPITLLWPLIVATVIFLKKRIANSILYLVLAFIPLIIWMVFMLANTGRFTLGESDRDMGHNLYQRIWFITETMDSVSASRVREAFLTQGEKGSISPRQYLSFIADYPVPFISHAIRDTLIFAFKSGVERITIDYFGISNVERKSLQNGRTGWRHMFEKEGIGPMLMLMLESQGLILLISLAGVVVMATLTLLAFLGTLRMIIDWKRLNSLQHSIAILLIALPIYIWLFSQVVNAMQSRHRAPAEAAIVLLATYGTTWLINWWLTFRMRNGNK